MVSKLFVRLQDPSIELTVVGVDGGGRKETTLVGFKRYEMVAASCKLEELYTIRKDIEEKAKSGVKDADIDTSTLDSFIGDNVLYFLNETLITVDEEGKKGKLKIKDTREAKQEEGFWETPEECKEVILKMYLRSLAWRLGFSDKLQDALLNTTLLEDTEKN